MDSNTKITMMPSKTFKIEGDRLTSTVIDGQQAISQAIDIMLSTDKRNSLALPIWFGTELKNLIGQDFGYVASEAERIIKDTLITDSRIKDITDFSISKYDADSITIKFTTVTIFGQITIEKEWGQ